LKRKINIIYFAYLKPNEWEKIVLEQLWSLKNSDLYDISDNIYISLCCNDTDLKRIKQHIWAKFKKIQIINQFKDNTYEYPGFKAIWEVSQREESNILYFHSKGMTSESKIAGVSELRKFLMENTVLNYKTYLNSFNENPDLDVACIFPSEFGFSWYNFFWINSEYVKKHLSIPEINKNRYYWERYIGSENSTKKDIVCYSPFLGYKKLGNKAQLYQLRKKIM
jgi:hypothetical protein